MGLLSLNHLAIFHPPGRLVDVNNPFGKDVANAALYRALVRWGDFARVDILNQAKVSSNELRKDLYALDLQATDICSVPTSEIESVKSSGTVLRGQPYLSELAWWRRSQCSDSKFSLTGLIHTVAPARIRERIGETLFAPVQPWDALICTSPAVQDNVRNLFDMYEEYVFERFGGQCIQRPQLPLIPLAVDLPEASPDVSVEFASRLRSKLQIDSDDIVVLWVGRLSFFEKAFPQSMFLAVEQAASQTSKSVHFLMVGWFPRGEDDYKLYLEAAQKLSPSVKVSFLDGNKPEVVSAAWNIADIFLSLVDNIQETFGLTPLEAMAFGLPVVASDWDGYRLTIRDEIDGFLIPTLFPELQDLGIVLANSHALELTTYQNYVGSLAQHISVDVRSASQALLSLIDSPSLRKRMGEAGRARVKSTFSWPVVVSQYKELFSELESCRQHYQAEHDDAEPTSVRIHPSRGNPFVDFLRFATASLGDDDFVQCGVKPDQWDFNWQQLQSVKLNSAYSNFRLNKKELDLLRSHLQSKQCCSVREIKDLFLPSRGEHVLLTLSWLCKYGLLSIVS